MVREYIGARYVPRFLGTYDPAAEYEALDVVDNGSGTSYIARKRVPAGTPLTTAEYWFLYGASSGAIIQLQNDMIAAQGDIINLQGDMTLAQGDITQIKLDITALQGSVLGLDNRLGNVESDLTALQNIVTGLDKKLLVIGNSYVNYDVAEPLKELFAQSYQYMSGGVGFVPYTGHTDAFEDVLDTAIAGLSNDEKNGITNIIFVSAVGDTRAWTESGDTSYKSALSTTLSNIQSKITANFPNCNDVSICLAESRNTAYFSNNTYQALFKIHSIFKLYASLYGMRYIGWAGFNSLFVNADFQSDGYHPSTTGALRIGTRMKHMFIGNFEYRIFHASGNVPCAYSNNATVTVDYSFTPDDVDFHIRRINATNGASVTLAANTPLLAAGDFPIPIPPPSQSIQIFSKLNVRTTGAQADYLDISLVGDSHGVGQFVNQFAPLASTVANATLFTDSWNSFGYKID